MIRFSVVFLAIFALAAPASAQLASPWQSSARSKARLIADEGLRAGKYHAGAEIVLEPNSITYWREPGEAGVPPRFDFSASTNVDKVEVQYPAPQRIAEAGGVAAFGYLRGVVFPLIVTPKDAGVAVHLEMEISYAACEKICVPAFAHGDADLSPGVATGELSPVLAQAEANVPKKLDSAVAGAILLSQPAGAKPAWSITLPATTLAANDLFVQAPEGWYFESKAGTKPGEFIILLADAPKTPDAMPVPVVLTFTGAENAVEFATLLDRTGH